ncbi:DOMON-like domain-containing protein [Propionivibrio soli]|uniref:DOMON-like domain-containing protein n=1 Tax=Propionivibrio soli TaxID=2976531 RepID=UPI0021E7A66D|nr:DOMON-like domain-containing protein [Propionivibrio soli]
MVRAVEAQARLLADGSLALTYCVWGDMARLFVPEPQAADRRDALWEHTCFEVFVAPASADSYVEFNFSPSGLWAAYAFSGYRQRAAADDPRLAPTITTHRFAGRLEVEAIVPAASLPHWAGTWHVGLSAVLEARDVTHDAHSYWALAHPAERPDFHHRGSFTLHLAVPPLPA